MGDNDDDDYDSVRMNKKLREGEYLASAESGWTPFDSVDLSCCGRDLAAIR